LPSPLVMSVCQSLESRETFTSTSANRISWWCSPWASCHIVNRS
jgi:hypothetical protein